MKKQLLGVLGALAVMTGASEAWAQSFTASYTVATINAGPTGTDLVFTITAGGAGLVDGNFTYTPNASLSGGTASTNCPGTPPAAANFTTGTLTVTGIDLAAAASCTVTLPITSVTPGSYPLSAATLNPGAVALVNGTNPTLAVLPTISSLNPTSGETLGGTSVVITGVGFTPNPTTAVQFGGTAATAFTVNSNTQITATSPARAAGAVRVTVTNGGQTSADTAADDYTYFTPVPTLSEWAMILFGVVLAGAAMLMIQRRRLRPV